MVLVRLPAGTGVCLTIRGGLTSTCCCCCICLQQRLAAQEDAIQRSVVVGMHVADPHKPQRAQRVVSTALTESPHELTVAVFPTVQQRPSTAFATV
jgi:hypothetical protein